MIKNKPNPLGKGLLPSDNPYEADSQTPLGAALAKKRKKLALDKLGHMSTDDQQRMGIANAD